MTSENGVGIALAVGSSAFIGSSFILKRLALNDIGEPFEDFVLY